MTLVILALFCAAQAATGTLVPTPIGMVHRVPYRLTETKHLLVRAKLNGKGPFNFLIDTGAPALFIGSKKAGEAGITADAEGWGTVDRLEIEGGAVVERVQARIQEPYQLAGMNAMGLAGVRLDGVLGFNVLARFRMEIDLSQPVMRWTRLDYEPPEFAGITPPPEAKPGVNPAQNLSLMEGLTKMLTALTPRRPEDTVTPRGFFGIELSDERKGVRVRAALAGSTAASAGLKSGDRITLVAVGGKPSKPVRTSADLLGLLSRVVPGDVVRFTVVRKRKTLEVPVRASEGGL